MKDTLSRAKEILTENNYTCVILTDEYQYTSHQRGVKPLLDWYDHGTNLKDGYAADKVVGKAAAYLYVLLEIKAVYAGVISKPAYEVFKKHNIEIYYDDMVEAIINRNKTGYCPMETAVIGIDTPEEALEAIKTKLNKLN